MSQKHDFAPSPPPTSVKEDVHPKERERIAQLIAAQKSGPALDIAKDIHRRCRSAASEALLLEVYGARLVSLLDRNLGREARALMDLVRERYPAAREKLREWEALIAARRGDLSALLEPLKDPSLPAEKLVAAFDTVRRELFDLRALAECGTLDPNHSLRVAAAALSQAFEAVTSGPVSEDALALPEVARSSPLAPWKMLVRAIAAYYRRDDGLCEKCVAAIEPDSAPARLAPALRVMIAKQLRPPQVPSPAAVVLVRQAGADIDSLRSILKGLDTALDRGDKKLIVQEIGRAVEACRESDPEMLERLKQHIEIRALRAGLHPDKVGAAMRGPSLKTAYFWRLLARALEEDKDDPQRLGHACSCWEEFRKHAVREGWLPSEGPAVASLYLHMADLLRHLDPDTLAGLVQGSKRSFELNAQLYRGQPLEIRALMPVRESTPYYLSPLTLLERASKADPSAENFQRWIRAADEISPANGDRVAERWCDARPRDIPPLLRLMKSAEERNALQKAFKLMEKAEAVDGVNPEVRRARLRLLVAIAIRHLKEKKASLAEKDLRQIEALPQSQQGDRPALIAALRYAWRILRNEPQEARSEYDETLRLLGDVVTTHVLFLHVEAACGAHYPQLDKPQSPPTVPLFAVYGRVCAAFDDVGVNIDLLDTVARQMAQELSKPDISADPRHLAALGDAALRRNFFPLAYAVAGVGMARSPEYHARFLFLRASALPPWESKRALRCAAAATELARRRHDSDLLRRIAEWRKEELLFDVPEAAQAAMDTNEIARLIEKEIREPLPDRPPRTMPDDDDEEEDLCYCPSCCAARGELPPELEEMVERLGPDVVSRALEDLLKPGGKKKGQKPKPPIDNYDLPF